MEEGSLRGCVCRAAGLLLLQDDIAEAEHGAVDGVDEEADHDAENQHREGFDHLVQGGIISSTSLINALLHGASPFSRTFVLFLNWQTARKQKYSFSLLQGGWKRPPVMERCS